MYMYFSVNELLTCANSEEEYASCTPGPTSPPKLIFLSFSANLLSQAYDHCTQTGVEPMTFHHWME